ncbi:MAG TPA: amidohydrolase family protein [Pseudonocardia sp.]|nr:amidohydrolase family protein [Pseudonocardia sp.]
MPADAQRETAPNGQGTRVPVVDSQVHVWLRPRPRYPWAPGFLEQLPGELVPRYADHDRSAEELVEMMDRVGVTTTLLTSPWLYGADHSYAFDSARRHPGRFVVVAPFELPSAAPGSAAPGSALSGSAAPGSALSGSALSAFAAREYALGPRILLGPPSGGAPVSPGAVDAVLADAARLRMPVFVSPMGRLDEVGRMARAYPEVALVLDHAGLWLAGSIARRWGLLAAVLELAVYPNVLVKCTGLPELSAMPYPFPDLWRILHPLLDRFGADRLMWGSDINQHRDRLTYEESLAYLHDSPEISDADRAQILGGTATRLLAARPVVAASARSGGGA